MPCQPASTPLKHAAEEPLVGEAWWALFDELRLARQAELARYGGAVAWIRKLREERNIYADADLSR